MPGGPCQRRAVVDTFTEISDFVRLARKRHPKIRAHWEDDLQWRDRGMAALEEGKTGLAENTFQKLVLSQPGHCDGYEGWARVCFETGRTQAASILMGHACSLARESCNRGDTDPRIVDQMEEFRREIAAALPG